MKIARLGALLFVLSVVSLAACGRDDEKPSPAPVNTSMPASGEAGAPSSAEGPKAASNGSGSQSGDGGVKGDGGGYFAGGSALPQ